MNSKYLNMTKQELIDLDDSIRDNPESKVGARIPYLYNSNALKKLDAIGWAIQNILDSERKDRDPDWSYSGYTGKNGRTKKAKRY